jgi:hypothetical protein
MALTLFVGTTAFADSPTLLQVAASVLKDSGFSEANHLSEIKVGVGREGLEDNTRHILNFHMPSGQYSCDMTFFKPVEVKQGNFLVQAQLDNCTDASGESISLNNDYTDAKGHTFFQRIFYDNNSKFRPMTEQEEIVARKAGHNSQSEQGSVNLDGTAKLYYSNDKVILFDGKGGALPFN